MNYKALFIALFATIATAPRVSAQASKPLRLRVAPQLQMRYLLQAQHQLQTQDQTQDRVRAQLPLPAPAAGAFPSIVPTDNPARSAPTPAARDRRLFRPTDALVAAGFTAATLLVFPHDRSIAQAAQRSSLQNNAVLKHSSSVLRLFDTPGVLVTSGVMYAVGRLGHNHVADAGLHTAEAVFVSAVATGALKVMAGRARPYVSADTNAHDFAFGRGRKGSDYESLPSGHASATFAFASALTIEASRWWPHAYWWIAPLAYGGATLVSASRVYNNEHWTSDVVAGAAIGTLSGLVTGRFNRSHAGNRIDRWFLPMSSDHQGMLLVPAAHGVAVLWTHPW